jgi:hypothetical protein
MGKLDNAGIATRSPGKPSSQAIKELLQDVLIHDDPGGLTPRVQTFPLSQGDHLLCDPSELLRFGFRGDDPLMQEQRSNQISQQSLAMSARSAQFPSCFLMAHDAYSP